MYKIWPFRWVTFSVIYKQQQTSCIGPIGTSPPPTLRSQGHFFWPPGHNVILTGYFCLLRLKDKMGLRSLLLMPNIAGHPLNSRRSQYRFWPIWALCIGPDIDSRNKPRFLRAIFAIIISGIIINKCRDITAEILGYHPTASILMYLHHGYVCAYISYTFIIVLPLPDGHITLQWAHYTLILSEELVYVRKMSSINWINTTIAMAALHSNHTVVHTYMLHITPRFSHHLYCIRVLFE